MGVRQRTDSRGRVRYYAYAYDVAHAKTVYIGSFDRRKDAEAAEYEAKRRLKMGEPAKPAPTREVISFDAVAKRWLAGLVSVRPSTRSDYDKAIRRIQKYLGGKTVDSITRRDVDAVVTGLSRCYAASTVRKTITVAKMIFRAAVDWDYIDAMPTGGSRLNLPKIKRHRFDPLSQDDVQRLLQAAPDYWRPWFLFMLTSGLRRAEAFGVQVSDLDLKGGSVRVRHQLIGGKLVDLKTDAADRTVPLPRQTVVALTAHLAVRPNNDFDLIFPSPEGRPVDADNFYSRIWMPTREAAGLPSLRIHDCRHHVASLLLGQGHSVKYVQQVMGHATAAVLLDIYAHVTAGEADKAKGDMERWLGSEQKARYAA